MSSADTWVQGSNDVAPAFRFANQGYDVWLGNNRGNQYAHVNPGITSLKAFHAYSFPELGKYDLPAQLDVARSISGQDKVTYVGHS
jgi:gastric triacylglycerol lipase